MIIMIIILFFINTLWLFLLILFLNWIIISSVSCISNLSIMCISIRSCFLNNHIIFTHSLTWLLLQIMLCSSSSLSAIIIFIICTSINSSLSLDFSVIHCVSQLLLFTFLNVFLRFFKKFHSDLISIKLFIKLL